MAQSFSVALPLHCAIFELTAEQARESAEWRLLAANIVDLITSRTSTNIEQDWHKLEGYLLKAYSSIAQELDKRGQAVS